MIKYGKKFLISLVWVAFMASLPVFAQSTAPKRSDYESTPFWVAAPTIPHVMLIMSKEYKMFQPAYAGLSLDIDGNGRLDTGFNSGVIYTGYFDPYSCYAYSKYSNYATGDTKSNTKGSTVVDTASRFRWANRSNTTARKQARPSVVPNYIDDPTSKVGLCGVHSLTAKGKPTFSGNWLNYIVSSRMDVLRKILYGGARVLDPENTSEAVTVLDPSFVPPDSIVWGADVFADNVWYKTPYNAYYSISDYTPYSRPKNDHAIYFSRVRNMSNSFDTPDNANPREALRVASNVFVGGKNFKPRPGSDVDQILDRRYWDWHLDVVPTVPNDNVIGPATNPSSSVGLALYNQGRSGGELSKPTFETYNVSVEVCDTRKVAPDATPTRKAPGESSTYGCFKYPNGNYKPTGLLQSFGADDKMLFGLITGGFGQNHNDEVPLATRGGILRNHVDSLSKSVDPSTGKLKGGGMKPGAGQVPKVTGIPWVLSQLNVAGKSFVKFGNSPYVNTYSWGNPLGEMLYEAVRYMGLKHDFDIRNHRPTPIFSQFETGTNYEHFRVDLGYDFGKNPPFTYVHEPYHDSGKLDYLAMRNSLYHWHLGLNNPDGSSGKHFVDLPLVNGKSLLLSDCAKPIILMFSGSDSSYDEFDGVDYDGLSGRPLLSSINAADRGKFPADGQKFNYKSYLKLISNNDQLYGDYLFPKSYNTVGTASLLACTEQALTPDKFADIVGICPYSPATKGTYSLAAMAYYARIHNFNNGAGNQNKYMSFYGVNLGAAFPEITFPGPGLNNATKITILPVATTTGEIGLLNFQNYYIDDLQLDRDKKPFHMEIVVNFSDKSKGGTFATNARVKYTIDLYSNKYLAFNNMLGTNAYDYLTKEHVVGPDVLKFSGVGEGNISWYKDKYFFEQKRKPYESKPAVEIHHTHVAGISILTKVLDNDASHLMGFGYTIAGATRSGTYIETGLRYDRYSKLGCAGGFGMNRCPPPTSPFNTPSGCHSAYVGTTPSKYGCGLNGGHILGNNNFQAVRFFEFDPNGISKQLPNPMWLAAKYGGFNDVNNNGTPDSGEWERTSGVNRGAPLNYYQVTNITDLVDQLRLAFEDISKVSQTGTASSASVNTILGSGLSVETRYHSVYDGGGKDKVVWVGSVFALFRDKWDNLREDTNENGVLDVATSPVFPATVCPAGGCGDRVVTFKPNEVDAGISLPTIQLWDDPKGDGNLQEFDENFGTNVELIKHVWNYPRILSSFPDSNMVTSRVFDKVAASSVRRIYSYFGETEADGTALWPSGGIQLGDAHLFDEGQASNPRLHKLMRQTSVEGTKKLINYTRGKEYPEFRSRSVVTPWPKPAGSPPGALSVWRMGDLMNSRPVIVGIPSFDYDLLYGDASYAAFKRENALRRQVAYFGSNDGILRAVNLGFYNATSDKGSAGYSIEHPTKNYTKHVLGAELWGYVPTSILPHLEWVADPEYKHAYYVDLMPQIFDITVANTGKASDWRTILVGGLRLGGRSISLEPTAGAGGEGSSKPPEYSYSEFFALDITDPEKEPKLLWRFSHPLLGMTSALPTVVRSVAGLSDKTPRWYAVLGSGPTDISPTGVPPLPSLGGGENTSYQGTSTHAARVFVVDAKTGGLYKTLISEPLTIPGHELGALIPSFFTSIVAPLATEVTREDGTVTWSNSMAYLSHTIVEPTLGAQHDELRGWGGTIERLRMVDNKGNTLPVYSWQIERLFDARRAITSSVNATKDKFGNIWVIFGSGRVWWKGDLTPCGLGTIVPSCSKGAIQSIYGIKEPMDENGKLTFEEVKFDDLLDVSGIDVYASGQLKIADAGHPFAATPSYLSLSAGLASSKYGGYRRSLDSLAALGIKKAPEVFEIVNTQPQLVALTGKRSLVALSSYLTASNVCNPEGEGFLLGYDTYTGLPAPYLASDGEGFEAGNPIIDDEGKEVKQATGVAKSGRGMPTEASFSITSKGIKATNSSSDSGIGQWSIPNPEGNVLSNQVLSWREVLDTGFGVLSKENLLDGMVAVEE